MGGTEWIAKLKVADLKEELKQRGLPITGLKAVLAARLTEAVEAELQAGGEPKERTPSAEPEADEQAEEPAAAEAAAEEPAAPAAEDPAAAAAAEQPVEAAAEPEPAAQQEEEQPPAPAPAAAEAAPEPASPPAAAADAAADAAPATETEAEEVLDYEGTPGPEVAAAEPEPAAAAAMQVDEPPAAAAKAGKRSSPEPAAADGSNQQQQQQEAGEEALPQRDQKRPKRMPIPVPGPRTSTPGAAAAGDKAAGSTPPSAAADAAERRSGTPAEAAAAGGSERKRKHEPIPVPSKAPAARPLRHSGSGVSSDGAAVAVAATAAPVTLGAPPTAEQEAAVAKAVEEAGELPEDATAALLITGLKRPFTPNALVQVLSETGIVKGMWLTKLKDTAYVVMQEASHAHATRKKLQGVEWPLANRSKLSLAFIAVDVAEAAIANEQAPPTSALRTLSSGRLASSGGSLPRSGSKLGPAADKALAAGAAAGAVKEGSPAAAGAAAGADGAEAPAAARPKILDRLKFLDDGGEGAGSPAAADADAKAAAAAPAAAEDEVVTLDDLFRKTKAKPHLYYLPLSEEEVATKKARKEAAAAAAAGTSGGGGGGSGHSVGKEPVGPAVMEGLGVGCHPAV